MDFGSRSRLALILTLSSALALGAGTAHAQISFDASIAAVFAPPYPSTWRSSNSFVTMDIANNTGDVVDADLQITLYKGGIPVGSTPLLARSYGPAPSAFLTTPQVTDWSRMAFSGGIGKSVDRTGH